MLVTSFTSISKNLDTQAGAPRQGREAVLSERQSSQRLLLAESFESAQFYGAQWTTQKEEVLIRAATPDLVVEEDVERNLPDLIDHLRHTPKTSARSSSRPMLAPKINLAAVLPRTHSRVTLY